MARAVTDIRSIARSHTRMALNVLAGIARQKDAPASARTAAAVALLDRGWGKAATTHTGPDGAGALRVTIRHLVEGMPDTHRVLDLPADDVTDQSTNVD